MVEGRRGLLVRDGQGDPGLDAVHVLSARALFRRGALGMHDALAGGHPVHRAGADDEVAADAVLVGNRALEQIGHGGKPDMRMRAHIETLARRIADRAEMIEEDERAHHAALVEGQDASHLEPAPQVAHARPDHQVDKLALGGDGFDVIFMGLGRVGHGAGSFIRV